MDIIWNIPGYILDGYAMMDGLMMESEPSGFELDIFKSGGLILELSSSETKGDGIGISICFIYVEYVETVICVIALYICFCDFN